MTPSSPRMLGCRSFLNWRASSSKARRSMGVGWELNNCFTATGPKATYDSRLWLAKHTAPSSCFVNNAICSLADLFFQRNLVQWYFPLHPAPIVHYLNLYVTALPSSERRERIHNLANQGARRRTLITTAALIVARRTAAKEPPIPMYLNRKCIYLCRTIRQPFTLSLLNRCLLHGTKLVCHWTGCQDAPRNLLALDLVPSPMLVFLHPTFFLEGALIVRTTSYRAVFLEWLWRCSRMGAQLRIEFWTVLIFSINAFNFHPFAQFAWPYFTGRPRQLISKIFHYIFAFS